MVKPVLEPTRDTLVQLSLALQDFQFEHNPGERLKTARLMQAALKKPSPPLARQALPRLYHAPLAKSRRSFGPLLGVDHFCKTEA